MKKVSERKRPKEREKREQGLTFSSNCDLNTLLSNGGGGSLGSLSSDGLLGESGRSSGGGTATLTTLSGSIVVSTLALAALTVSAVLIAVAVVVVVSISSDDGDAGKLSKTHRDEQVLGLSIDGDGLSEILHDGVVGDDVLTALALLLLKLEGDSTNGTLSDTLHQVGSETGNLVAETLGGDLSDLRDDLLVGGEVNSQLGVVLLDDDASGLLNSLSSNATLQIMQESDTQGQFPCFQQGFITTDALQRQKRDDFEAFRTNNIFKSPTALPRRYSPNGRPTSSSINRKLLIHGVIGRRDLLPRPVQNAPLSTTFCTSFSHSNRALLSSFCLQILCCCVFSLVRTMVCAKWSLRGN